MVESFRALLVEKDEKGVRRGFQEMAVPDLSEGEVLIRVRYSGVNFKDGLAQIENGNVARRYPLVPGIDLAGTVASSEGECFREGDEVLATGYDLGTSHHGGFAEYARVPAAWVVPMPRGLTPRQAMALGTAGITAAQAIVRLEENGLTPERGPVLVTGATGGVGCLAVDMLAAQGYAVEASTGKDSEHDFLRALGARQILDRSEFSPETVRPLDRARWAGAIDPVGGRTLAHVLSRLLPGGSAAAIGLTGGPAFSASVFPFILRGVNLLGIDSAYLSMARREMLWERLAGDLRPPHLDDRITQEAEFADLLEVLERILKGQVRGRIVVRIAG